MPQGARTERVGEEFREILAEEIQRLKDPRVGFVTVTGVDVTPDLKRARVYYTAYGDERAQEASRAALRSATPHLRRALGSQVRLKVVPELIFEVDASLETGQRIDRLLDAVASERDRSPGGALRAGDPYPGETHEGPEPDETQEDDAG